MRDKALHLFISLFLFVLTAFGQEQKNVFPDGTTVIFENKVTSKNSGQKVRSINILTTPDGLNIVHRAFVDQENKSHFGYDLEIKKDDKSKYIVTFKPFSIILFVNDSERKILPKFPEPLQLNEGDTISVDLLENPKTKEKIADLIKIVQGEANQKNNQENRIIIPDIPNARVTQSPKTITHILSSDPSALPKDFTLDEIRMQLINANLVINGKEVIERQSVLAGNLYFYLKGKGRFILSAVPREGYKFQKNGLINMNKVSFEFNGDKYEINATFPIMFYGGKWNLWVLHEPDYIPGADTEVEFGGGSMDALRKEKGKK